MYKVKKKKKNISSNRFITVLEKYLAAIDDEITFKQLGPVY